MNHGIHKYALSLLAALPMAFFADVSNAQMAQPIPAPASPTLARLLDDRTPAAERQQLFEQAKNGADAGDTQWQYIVGSLLGRNSGTLPVPADPDKARVYLSNAAIHGNLLAMAKMAESEVVAKNYQEAMNWAQIYSHYLSQQSTDNRPAKDYASELVARISEQLDSKKMAQVQADVAAFIASNDASIHAGPRVIAPAPDQPAPKFAPHPFHRLNVQRQQGSEGLRSCFADYLIAFKADGTVEKAWLVDVVPNAIALDYLQGMASAANVQPLPRTASDGTLRYAFASIVFDDGRYHVRGGHVVNGHGI